MGIGAFRGQSGRQPVELAGFVVVYSGEPEVLEPPRGSGAQVSGGVPAVHDDRAVGIEEAASFTLQHAKGQADRSREVILLVFRGW
jgi:hypothetical protein